MNLKTLIIACFCLASCSTHILNHHKDVKIGISEAQFDSISVKHLKYTNMHIFKDDSIRDDNYVIYKAQHPSHLYGEFFYYLFKNDSLIYYNQTYRLLVHDNDLYRKIAIQAEEAFDANRIEEDRPERIKRRRRR